jgi:hypothetical protein
VIDRRDERWEPDIVIEYFGGAAPVQAWGTVAGKRFYFRARHNEWSFGIALNPAVDPVDVQVPGAGFFVEEVYGTNSDASYMPEDMAETIIRRCARLFHEPIKAEGKFMLRRGMAKVEVSIDLTALTQGIAISCQGATPTFSQGETVDVPAEGFNDWKQGAVAGVTYALTRVGDPAVGVTIRRIWGLFSDTNPTLVGAAAIDAVWKALQIPPEDADVAHVQKMALSSWDRPTDDIPKW